MLILFVKLLLAYLLGSLSGSLILGRFRGVDIRTQGSGNAGGTNAFRTQGWRFALGVVAIDIAKGALASGLAFLPPQAAGVAPLTVALACGVACAIGHVWPVFFGFRGGKGAAVFIGVLAVCLPMSIPFLLLAWLLVLTITGYVGLATIVAGIVLVPVALWLGHEAPVTWVGFACAIAALLVFTHRSNVARLISGTENRFEKVRIWHRLVAPSR
jgi:glycerol-3-phosphate acyltransferase PlsY